MNLTKVCDTLSKVGDPINCAVTILNTSSADSPNLILDSFVDSKVPGVVPPAACSPLAPAASCTINYSYTPVAGDPDPLLNTATVHYHPAGFPNDIWDADTWSTNLFQPGVNLTKVCDTLSKVGDPINCVVTILNTSSVDSPNLVLDSFVDSKVPGVARRPPAARWRRLPPAPSTTATPPCRAILTRWSTRPRCTTIPPASPTTSGMRIAGPPTSSSRV